MEVKQKATEGIRPGVRIVAVWPTGGPKVLAYETYVFHPIYWHAHPEVQEHWVSTVIELITDHLRSLNVNLSTVWWEMLHPIEGSR